jgi:Xaa-Pro aminopeptidase
MSAAPVAHELDGFRRAQRLAYDAAMEVAADLAPGVTEKEAAARLGAAIESRGVHRYFHHPFAWFGERTRFEGFRRISGDFFPSSRKLSAGMIAILDVAPIVDGFAADIGYTFACGGHNETLDRAMTTLREIRELIPPCIARGDTMRSIYVRIDRLLAEQGYENRHAKYPYRVLGHRVDHVPQWTRDPKVASFGLASLVRLMSAQLASRLPPLARRNPLWNDSEACNRPVEPGLWAVEPHLGGKGYGAKFEELLVVERGGRAFWLDDDLPHVRPPVSTPPSRG